MAGSFWSNFGLRFSSSSNAIDEILEKGNFTLEEIISHDQVIQECKYMNQQLCEYLSQPKVVKQLVQYVITIPSEAKNLNPASEDVGGSSDEYGNITTAASVRRKKMKAAKKQAESGNSSDPSSASGSSHNESSTTDSKNDAESESTNYSQHSSSDEDDDSNTTKNDPEKEEDDKAEKEAKYPYLASELFSCEVATMLDAIFEPHVDDEEAANDSAAHATLDKVSEEAEDATSPTASPTTDAAAPLSPPATSAASNNSSNSAAATSAATSPSPANSTTPRLPILDLLLSFLDQPAPIDPAHASYFRKVMVVLIQRKYEPLVRYMAAHGTIDKLLTHIGLYSIMELLIMIGWDDGLGGSQDVSWLVENDLTGKLIEKLNPDWDTVHHQPDVLINASRALVDVVVKCAADKHNPLITRLLAHPCQQLLFKHMFSGNPLSMSNALSIVIVLVQRYANRMDLGEEIMDEVKAAALAAQAAALDAPDEDSSHAAAAAAAAALQAEAHADEKRLPEPFHSLVPHLAKILRLLQSDQTPEESFSYGRGRAFGETRLKVVELILVLVRCKVKEVEDIFIQENLLAMLLDAFVKYPWNNMLHGLVESIVRTILEFLDNTDLKPNLFLKANLPQTLIDAYKKNEDVCAKGKGFRLGYMGHLLRTAEVVELYIKEQEGTLTASGELVQPADPAAAAAKRLKILGTAEDVAKWDAFVKGPLADEEEKQKVVLPSISSQGNEEEDFPGDEDALAALGSFAANVASNNSKKANNDADYAFDPDDSSSLPNDHPGALEYNYSFNSGAASNSDWDFNPNFGGVSFGESPGSNANNAAGGAAKQRNLMEFSLAPDEDGDHSDDEDGDDWANFGSASDAPAAAAAAPARPASPKDGATATTNAASSDFAADFDVEFPK